MAIDEQSQQRLERNMCNVIHLVPQRYILGLMGCLATVNAYLIRIVLSVAITEMVLPANKTIHKTSIGTSDTCSIPIDANVSHLIAAVQSDYFYNWSETIQGLVLSSFYWGYLVTQLPGGILAEKFGGKYTLGLGLLSASLLTLLTPIAVKAGDWPWLIVIRVLIGMGEGTIVPSINVLLAKWTPKTERSILGTLVFAGAQVGTVIGNAASGIIITSAQTWESVFYVFGVLGVVWFILWVLLCHSTPQSHPFISDKERMYLERELAQISRKKHKIPWKSILTSVPLWALVAAQLGHDWGASTMVADLPKYMKTILKFNVKQSGIWSALPYLVMWIVSMASATLCDWLIKQKYMTTTFARKFFTTVSSIGPAVFMIAASYAGCDRVATVICFTTAMGFMGTFYCGMKVNSLDLSTNFAGILMAIVNGIGALSSMVTPSIAGILTEDQTLSQWRTIFWITFGIFVVTNIIFVAFGSGEEQWWNAVGVEVNPERSKLYKNGINTADADDNDSAPVN